MPDSYRALCSDFYINQKVSVKLDLPSSRETVLDLFERVRREYPAMQSFRRYEDELALESIPSHGPSRWLAIKPANIRSGVVNPDSFEDAYGLHRCVLEVAPYFLSISALDIEFVELLFGFDMVTTGNHDAIVAAALLGDSPLASLMDVEGATAIDCQPLYGMKLGHDATGIEAHFEVKTRRGTDRVRSDPISIYLTMRQYDPGVEVEHLPGMLDRLAERGEHLVNTKLVPALLAPIRAAIASSGG
ncbi:MAG: hypothetical protein KF757_11610 [Phycisphaeraceae bacterium]|nr:hypothetical protein [Phycisphaeraceae bacterium]MCW5762334.1 hypothetical protein [Phycisphaeraceae bacterium]